MTHICVSNLIIIGSDNGLSPGRRQAIIWTNAGIFLIGPLRTNFNEILIEILTFSFKKMRLKVSSAKWRPFCLGLNVLSMLSFWTCMMTLWHEHTSRITAPLCQESTNSKWLALTELNNANLWFPYCKPEQAFHQTVWSSFSSDLRGLESHVTSRGVTIRWATIRYISRYTTHDTVHDMIQNQLIYYQWKILKRCGMCHQYSYTKTVILVRKVNLK